MFEKLKQRAKGKPKLDMEDAAMDDDMSQEEEMGFPAPIAHSPPPSPPRPPKPPTRKEYGYTMNYTRSQILGKLERLQSSEDLALYLRVINGEEEYEEYTKLKELLGDV